MSNNNYNKAIDAVIEKESKDASRTIKKKLIILVEVCSSQIEANSHDFTIATVAKLFKAKGGINEQSINNPGGEKYKNIIEAFQNYHGVKSDSAKKEANKYEWVGKLDRGLARFEVRELISENKRLKSQLQTQVEINREHAPLIDMRNKKVGSQNDIKALGLTANEIETLKEFFSEDNLKELGLTANKKGRLVDDTDTARSKPGFVNLINKICGVKDNTLDIKGIN
ncbi:MAG: hypothetical protein ACI92X_002025 [Dokdonia sp.]|jgi:hypothetical protein